VENIKPKHPYFEAWLRRTRKQLSVSGRISQMAHHLFEEDGVSAEEWQRKLRGLIDGRIPPTFELISKVDSLLTACSNPSPEDDSQLFLF